MKQSKSARQYITRALEISPQNPVAKLLLAQLEFNARRTDKAMELLQGDETLTAIPAAQLLNGKIANQRGNHELAITYLRRYLLSEPDNQDGLIELAKAYIATGDHAQALAAVKPAATRISASPALLTLAAKLAGKLNDPQASAMTARMKLAADEGYARQMMRADQAIRAQKWDDADAIYAALRTAGQQDNPAVLNNSALVALERSDAQSAIRHARAALTTSPDDPLILDTLGWIILQTGGSQEEALALLYKAAALAPKNREIQNHLAKASSTTSRKVDF